VPTTRLLRPSDLLSKQDQVRKSQYLIQVTCLVFHPDDSAPEKIIRSVVFSVLRNFYASALLEVVHRQGDNWETVRTPEYTANTPFEKIENRIRELWASSPIDGDASFVLQYDQYTDKVSNSYMREHGFSKSNVPWSGLARYYTSGAPLSRAQLRNIYGDNTTGLHPDSWREAPNTNMDAAEEKFSPDDIADAERSAEVLQRAKLVS